MRARPRRLGNVRSNDTRSANFGKAKTIKRRASLLISMLLAGPAFAGHDAATEGVIRTAQSGPWSAAATWEGGKVPGSLAKVLVRRGHMVRYDIRVVARAEDAAGNVEPRPHVVKVRVP